MKRTLFAVMLIFFTASVAFGADDPMTKLKDDTLSFFRLLSGKVTGVEGNKVSMTVDAGLMLKPGMRVNVLREGESFRHPLTKEPLGKVESLTGKVEIKDAKTGSVSGVIVEGSVKEGDKIRISGSKTKLLFCQDKKVDWYLADDLYRKLKGSGRIEMIDTALETDDQKKVIEEAKRLGAEVALIITAKEADKGTLVRERLFWVSDGSQFFDSEIKVDAAFAKDLKFGGEFFGPLAGESLFKYDLPFAAGLVITGDFDGDGRHEIVLSNGKNATAYMPSIDLQMLWELKGNSNDDHLWIDAVDLNRNGRDELIITSMRSGEIVSSIYERSDTEFKKLWEGKYFMRKSGSDLIAQKYSQSDGFEGDVFIINWNGEYKNGEKVKLPKGVNIYDFVYIEGAANERYMLAYDERGFLNLYDPKGIRVWVSNANAGGFRATFKKQTPASYVQAGEWTIKDRLIQRNREVIVAQRIPFVEMAQGLGHKSSRLKSYWWNGFSMDESVLISDIQGSVLDYTLAGDKLVVLSSPFLGLKFGNVLKGENPLGNLLFIYSVQGR